MLHPMVKRSIPYALTAALLMGTLPSVPILAATGTATPVSNTVFTPAAVGKVSIGGNSYIQLQEVHMLGQTVSFTIAVVNNGTTDLDFIDYWLKLRSVKGSEFSINLTAKDKDKNRIPAKTTETFTYYSTVSANTQLSDLKFDFIKWDFSVSSFQRYLGSVRVPAKYTTKTPVNQKLNMLINGTRAAALIKSASVARTSDEYAANLTFVIENTGTKSITLPGFGFNIVTSEGLVYPLEVEGLEENASIHPRFTKELTLKGDLPASLENKYWKLVMTEKGGESSPELPIASFNIPASTATVVKSIPVGGKKELVIKDQKVTASVDKSVRNENDKNYMATITYSFVNQGTEPVALPQYSFLVKTSAGLTYPVTVNTENVRLDPRVQKDLQLKVTVPVAAGKDGWKLVLQEPVTATKPDGAKKSVATFELPNDNPTGLNQGTSFNYSNEDGTYTLTFNSVQRLPWEDQDILAAGLTIANKGNNSLPIADLQGYFMLDGKIKVEAKMVNKDALIALKPGSSIGAMLYGKIPYTYQYSKLDVVLEEKQDENTTAKVVEFTTNSNLAAIPVVDLGKSHNIEGAGRSAAISMRSVRTYEGIDGGNMFSTLVDVKNLEKRYSDIAPLVGHFKSSDGLMFPVKFTEFSGKVSPQGVATLMASSTIPATVNTADLKLVLGEGILAGGGTGTAATTDAYMNAAEYKLPLEESTKSNFNDLALFPYTISLKNVRARLSTMDSFNFSFDYELTKNTFVQNTESDHQITVQLVDNGDSEIFTKTFSLGDKDSETNDTRLELGKHSKLFEESSDSIFTRLQYIDEFYINIYDEYNGVKKKLATIPYDWYAN